MWYHYLESSLNYTLTVNRSAQNCDTNDILSEINSAISILHRHTQETCALNRTLCKWDHVVYKIRFNFSSWLEWQRLKAMQIFHACILLWVSYSNGLVKGWILTLSNREKSCRRAGLMGNLRKLANSSIVILPPLQEQAMFAKLSNSFFTLSHFSLNA